MKVTIRLREVERRVISCTIDPKPEANDTPRVSLYGLAIVEAIKSAADPHKEKKGHHE